MNKDMVCTEHDKDIPVLTESLHGREIVTHGWCDEDGGHEVQNVT